MTSLCSRVSQTHKSCAIILSFTTYQNLHHAIYREFRFHFALLTFTETNSLRRNLLLLGTHSLSLSRILTLMWSSSTALQSKILFTFVFSFFICYLFFVFVWFMDMWLSWWNNVFSVFCWKWRLIELIFIRYELGVFKHIKWVCQSLEFFFLFCLVRVIAWAWWNAKTLTSYEELQKWLELWLFDSDFCVFVCVPNIIVCLLFG